MTALKMENVEITLETPASSEAQRVIYAGLFEFNEAIGGTQHYKPLNLIVRDSAGTVIGGLLGDTYWNWLAINLLWLREDMRMQGLGSRLLLMAEEEAVRRGCQYTHLDTFDFQGLEFYKKRGYIVFGELEGQPPGHSRYYLRKTLS